MYHMPFDYRQLTAKDRRFHAAFVTALCFLVLIVSLFFLREIPEAAAILAVVTAALGLLTWVEHRQVRREAEKGD